VAIEITYFAMKISGRIGAVVSFWLQSPAIPKARKHPPYATVFGQRLPTLGIEISPSHAAGSWTKARMKKSRNWFPDRFVVLIVMP